MTCSSRTTCGVNAQTDSRCALPSHARLQYPDEAPSSRVGAGRETGRLTTAREEEEEPARLVLHKRTRYISQNSAATRLRVARRFPSPRGLPLAQMNRHGHSASHHEHSNLKTQRIAQISYFRIDSSYLQRINGAGLTTITKTSNFHDIERPPKWTRPD